MIENALTAPPIERRTRVASFDERLYLLLTTAHESVGDKAERGAIDIAAILRDQTCEAFVEAGIFAFGTDVAFHP